MFDKAQLRAQAAPFGGAVQHNGAYSRDFFFSFFPPSAASRPSQRVQLTSEAPVHQSYSVEVSTLDFDSSIPGSNPGRTTRFLHTFRGVKAVRNSCNSSRKFGKRPKSYEAAEVTLDGSGCRLQTCRRLVSQRFDSASTAPAPCASARAHEPVHSRPGHNFEANVPERSKGEVLSTSDW